MGKKEFQEKCSTEPVGGLKNRQARASKDKQGGKKDFKKKGGDRKIVREKDIRSHGDPKTRLRAFMEKQKAERGRRDHSNGKGSEPRRRRYKCAFTTRSTGSTRSGRRYALHQELAKNFKKNGTGQGCSAGRSEEKELKKAHRDLLLELSKARTVPKREGNYKQKQKQKGGDGGERCGKEHTPSPEIIKNEDSATQKSGERRKEQAGHASFNEGRREDDALQKNRSAR